MDIDEKKIINKVIPIIISALINDGLISDESTEKEVKEAVQAYIDSDNIDSWDMVITASDVLMETLEYAVDNNQYDASVTLTGIIVEQMINEFYNDVLIDKHNFSKTEYDSCMKVIPTKDKLTWLYRITTSESIDSETVSRIDNIRKARNDVVHYKPKRENINATIKWQNIPVDIDELLPLIDKLKRYFQECIYTIFPENKMAEELFEKFFSNCDRD